MGTRAMINFKINDLYVLFHNQYDGQWNSLGAELSQWVLSQDDLKALETITELFKSKYYVDSQGNYDLDAYENKWGELATGAFWDWYFCGFDKAPDVEHSYNYLWQVGKWFAYDYDFKTWRPLHRVVKRDYLSQYELVGDCFVYKGRFAEWELADYFNERIDIRNFYIVQNMEAEKRNIKEPFMYSLFKAIS